MHQHILVLMLQSQSEVDKLKEQVELLKRVTDVEYAKECVRKEIL